MKKSLPIILSILVIISITGNVLLYSKLNFANIEKWNLNVSIVEFQQSIEPMSVTMYALADCDTYSKPDETSDKVTTVENLRACM